MNKQSTVHRRGVVVGICALTIIAGSATAWGLWGGTPATHKDGSVPSDCAVLRKTSFKITAACTGRLEARRQIEIRSELDWRSNIVELVPEGKAVKAGEQLLRLNTDELEQQLREEQLAVETARADTVAADNGYDIQVNENASKLRQAESKLKLAELARQQWEQGDVKKKHKELELAIEKTTRDLERLVKKVETSRALQTKGFLSENELQLDEIAETEARSAAETAKMDDLIYRNFKHPEELETKTASLDEAKSELERVKLNNQIELTSKESSRTTKRKQLEIRDARLAELQKQLEKASIKAPVDGLVVYAFSMGIGWRETPLQIGQPVYRNELVMILPDTSEMLAGVSIHESLSGRVKPGQPVDIKIDAAGGRVLRGTVESLGVLAESGDHRDQETREYKVKIAISPESYRGIDLKPSMRADATIILGEVTDVLALPIQSVFNDGALKFVYVHDGERAERVPVTIGRISTSFAEITGGLPEGSVVLTRSPKPGEASEDPWDAKVLAGLGFELDSEGRPMAIVPPVPPPPADGGAKPGAEPSTAAAQPAGGQVGKTPAAPAVDLASLGQAEKPEP
jgi:HlyD family secretion protein